MMPNDLADLAAAVLQHYQQASLTIATAESCTGGLLAACLTEIPGASAVYDRGWVTYSNEAKTEMLGVPAPTLNAYGAVSAEVAEAMVGGVLERSSASAAISITGIAGPGGATATKPVGLVYIGYSRRSGPGYYEKQIFNGARSEIRLAAVQRALVLLRDMAGETRSR